MKSIRITIEIPTKGWNASVKRPEHLDLIDVESVYSAAILFVPWREMSALPAWREPHSYRVALMILRSLALQKESYRLHGWSGMSFEDKRDVYRRAARLLDYDV